MLIWIVPALFIILLIVIEESGRKFFNQYLYGKQQKVKKKTVSFLFFKKRLQKDLQETKEENFI
ncbi:hypothetical protein BIV60_21555 [Bacillus sp. MUM 116]|uniref:hypothetical protein n=1 Tax=Bacillus sp. MUM 116 TaxID=1678002 RepID=UPI0008F5F390|nr:hypothetical protein [Bacillus sp. MUM 116]OIK10337.1 hypothetical protein BIV60_21555 [Bacillus sp. MUM 116]